ncbi:MAG TPA: IPT/TIG domain-containing protein, partial [Acidobacteriaceae bacterium]|nr:IPT/TIG domain-containing protein [Acidobacteriaceae bacterium]
MRGARVVRGGGIWVARVVGLLGALALLMVFCAQTALAGGPRWVAGTSYFNAVSLGQPVVWAGGQVTYYTDQSALSAQVTQAQANTMVATAAAVWSSVKTAAVSIGHGGNLAEDVDQAVTTGANGIVLPADIQPGATSTPVGVVYDETGAVINGIYGAGANSPLNCQDNGVITTVDNLETSGNIAHALIVVNGQCAGTVAQRTNLQYQLVRAFGEALGLDWSQTNEEMFVGDQITSEGLAGWPIMHPMERLCNGGGGMCMPNGTTLRTDDIAALNRLYPVTAANIGSFTGKTLTAAATISVQGTITFALGQGMQGVNVVLRPLVNGVPEVSYTATAVTGRNFLGNAGNPITGTADAQGKPLTRFGTNDATQEGFFDLSAVPLPPGVTQSDYQLTFEAINPLYTNSESVGPYTTGQVTPSGTMPVITLTGLSAGSTVTETVVIENSADEAQSGNDGSAMAPASVPPNGEWSGRITGYGHSGWFAWWAQAGREFTIEAQALDETGANTENKAQMVIGAWNGTDAVGTPPVTATVQPFNGAVPGLTALPVMTDASAEVRVGLADWRGDGRPDYAYHGRILYAGSVTPTHVPAAGGPITIEGMGFRPSTMAVTVNGVAAQVTSVTPNAITAVAPPSGGVTGDVPLIIEDTQTLGIAAVTAGFSYDAGNNDALTVLTAPNVSPMGVPEPMTVRAENAATLAPATDVTVTFTVSLGTAALGCGQPTCSVSTAGDGSATLLVTANSTAAAQVTASLTNGASVAAQITGTAPPAIAALTPNLYIAMGATVPWPVAALAMS